MVIDIGLPDEEALDLVRVLRRNVPEVKIIALIGFDPAFLSAALESGASYTFVKPFRMQDFLQAVAELLNR